MADARISLRKRGYPQLVRAHVRGAAIPPEVQAEVGHYLTSRPDIRACEAAEHGYDPAQDIPRYLAQELAEPEHATIRSGPLTVEAVKEWERQEDAEHAADGHGHIQKDDTTHAGIVVRAADTGRILMLQRSIADPSDPARGAWEFPGGEIEPGETPKQGAVREWQEETGTTLPPGDFVGEWKDGIYEGFVYLVEHEADVPLNVGADDRLICNPDDPDCDDAETLAWWAPTDARKNPALRDAVKGSDWRVIDAAAPDAIFKSFPRLVFRKDSPTATDVHVDVPLGSEPKKKRKKGEPAEPEITVVKADDEQRVVYGIVLEPDVEDSQGDVVSKDDVELAAHRYVYQNIRPDIIGDQHGKMAPPSVRPVESFIAPCDFEMGGQTVRKGSWVLVGKIDDDDLWQQVKKGDKGAWSVGGTGKRSPL